VIPAAALALLLATTPAPNPFGQHGQPDGEAPPLREILIECPGHGADCTLHCSGGLVPSEDGRDCVDPLPEDQARLDTDYLEDIW
jgi:hypothetical protein